MNEFRESIKKFNPTSIIEDEEITIIGFDTDRAAKNAALLAEEMGVDDRIQIYGGGNIPFTPSPLEMEQDLDTLTREDNTIRP